MKLYHGSMIEHLSLSNSGTGLGYNFGAVFFAARMEQQRDTVTMFTSAK